MRFTDATRAAWRAWFREWESPAANDFVFPPAPSCELGWQHWMDNPPPQETRVEILRYGETVISTCIPRDQHSLWNVANLYWRFPPSPER